MQAVVSDCFRLCSSFFTVKESERRRSLSDTKDIYRISSCRGKGQDAFLDYSIHVISSISVVGRTLGFSKHGVK